MPKRTAEQALRDDLATAKKVVAKARKKLADYQQTAEVIQKAVNEAKGDLVFARVHRDRIVAALAAITGVTEEVQEVSDESSPATGAVAGQEVLEPRKDVPE